ncbi:hypothetical protein LSH36_161g09019 [Paralvinella palmiformis]|uniref:CS domain-containing protein n=1 Tax=Paralvinella palmiformis TaxID=53620 RepID=A0AAD9N9E7_9ANNE|nr:hypothetical protein LSH36_161g09019 [Paralvinella palmiformis]
MILARISDYLTNQNPNHNSPRSISRVSMANDKHPPPVIWAERADKLYVTICVEDCKDPVIKFDSSSLFFSGTGGPENKEYEVKIEFLKEIDPEASHYAVLARHIPMVVKKKGEGPYWGRLMKEKGKVHWLKTDFNKWKDEDDSDFDEAEDMQFENMMKKMGNFNTEEAEGPPLDEEQDSDDEELPDLDDSSEKKPPV